MAVGAARSAGHYRKPAGGKYEHLCTSGNQFAARRVHIAVLFGVDAHQHDYVSQPAIRRAAGHCAGFRSRRLPHGVGCASIGPSQDRRRADSPRQGKSGQSDHGLVWNRVSLALSRRAVQDDGRDQLSPCPLSRRRARGDCSLGGMHIKDFSDSVPVWQVIGASAVDSRFEALHGTNLTPLVGREAEIALLLERWERAKEGDGQVVLLSGEPGIGKSRIVQDLRVRLSDELHTRLSHYCSQYHTSSPLYPVIGLLERAADFDRRDTVEAKLNKLEALLALSATDVREAAALLAAVLAIPTDHRYPPLALTPQRQKQRTLEVLVDQLAGLAGQRPVLAIYEDAHWMDPSTSELLGLVIQRVQRLPTLVLITFRPEFIPPWTSHAHVTQLSLSRLTRRQASVIALRVTGGKVLPAEVLEQIVSRTDGVPLFVEELTKAVVESGLVQNAGSRFELTGPLPPRTIPATLHDSSMARLDRFSS